MGVISKYFSLCKNFHSKAGMGVNSDMGVISIEYGICFLASVAILFFTLYVYKCGYRNDQDIPPYAVSEFSVKEGGASSPPLPLSDDVQMSRNAIAHPFKKLRGPARCRECDTYVYFHGFECGTVSTHGLLDMHVHMAIGHACTHGYWACMYTWLLGMHVHMGYWTCTHGLLNMLKAHAILTFII